MNNLCIILLVVILMVWLIVRNTENLENTTSTKTTLLTNVFNEEYLLPFWLQHHREMFDDLIVIDYRSTDNSMMICRSMWPDCKIIPTRNAEFDAINIDKECMDIEDSIEGIKMVLNTTEFLFLEKPIKDIFSGNTEPISYGIICYSPYSKYTYTPYDNHTLFSNLLNDDVVFHADRFTRQIHTYSNGNYTHGRHTTHNKSVETKDMHVLWLGFYPMNDNLVKRKRQIGPKRSSRDVETRRGWHHDISEKEILTWNNDKVDKGGTSLKKINPNLYSLLKNS